MKGTLIYLAAFVIGGLLIALPVALRSDEFQNTLLLHQEWRVSKVLVEMELMGAPSYLKGTQALAGNSLNLNAWHGYQEVMNRHEMRPREVSFRFMLGENGWLCFIFNRVRVFDYEDGRYHALRISTRADRPSELLEVNGLGEFLNRTRFAADGRVTPGIWHELLLVWENSELAIYLDKEQVDRLNVASIGAQRIGFRGGANPARIDRVEVVNEDGTSYRTSFGRFVGGNRSKLRDSTLRLWVGILLGAAMGVGMLYAITRKWRSAAATVMALFATAALTLWPYVLLEDRLMAGYYPVVDEALMEEEQEHVAGWIESVKREIAFRHPPDSVPPNDAILVVGTSQTWGSGANTRDQRWVKVLEDNLNAVRDESERVCLLNGAVPGSNSTQLLELYQDFLVQYRHGTLLLNLGCNDRDPEVLSRNLEEFIRIARDNGVQPLIVVEALSDEEVPGGTENLPVMKAVAETHNVPFFSLGDALEEDYDKGFFWWDVVHPTSYGHRRIAEVLTGFVEEHMSWNIHRGAAHREGEAEAKETGH